MLYRALLLALRVLGRDSDRKRPLGVSIVRFDWGIGIALEVSDLQRILDHWGASMSSIVSLLQGASNQPHILLSKFPRGILALQPSLAKQKCCYWPAASFECGNHSQERVHERLGVSYESEPRPSGHLQGSPANEIGDARPVSYRHEGISLA